MDKEWLEIYQNHLALIFSGVALIISILNFYWFFLRHKKALYLVRIDETHGEMNPEFVLTNGGNRDLIITHLTCSFSCDNRKSVSTPAQKIDYIERESLFLLSDKAIHCKVGFIEPFTKSFALHGKQVEKDNRIFYMYDMYVDVDWVQSNGVSYSSSTILFRYGFSDDGKISRREPVKSNLNLYSTAKKNHSKSII